MRNPPIPPPVWMLIVGAAMWALNQYWPVRTLISDPWRPLGWCVMAIAPITPVVAMVQFRRANTTANPHTPQSSTRLVTTGVYAWTRNPMYLGLSILLFGWAVKLRTLSPVVGPLLFIPLIWYVQIRPEEHALRAKFGAAYDEYCRHVRRWLGRSRRAPQP
jgi:protein-S-isoprenylcysteine O-methyltransferase Ste14